MTPNKPTDYDTQPAFAFGRIVATPSVLQALEQRGEPQLLYTLLARHQLGDWGDVCAEDAKANDKALRAGERLLSSYKVDDDLNVWIVTEWDRSVTTVILVSTVLLPVGYAISENPFYFDKESDAVHELGRAFGEALRHFVGHRLGSGSAVGFLLGQIVESETFLAGVSTEMIEASDEDDV